MVKENVRKEDRNQADDEETQVNIAVVKYWGKRDKRLILPCNSSLSVTLDQQDLHTTTTARLLDHPQEPHVPDTLWLNGSLQIVEEGSRLATCLHALRRLKKLQEDQRAQALPSNSSSDSSTPPVMILTPIVPFLFQPVSRRALVIGSENNFPTAAGLASSASGFAALVYAISKLYELPIDMTELSKIARQGSGSACRSMFGGFVSWEMGSSGDGTDSAAEEVAPRSHWPEMEALICVVSDRKKGTSSTSGMDVTVQTSALLKHRVEQVVPARMKEMKEAIGDKDFDRFARLTMADSNQFHAVCLDSQPPIFYLNDVSRSIITLIEELNRASNAQGLGYVAAYTFDAGPNAVIYAPRYHMRTVLNLILHYFPMAHSEPFLDPKGHFDTSSETPGQLAFPKNFNPDVSPIWPQGSISRLIHTQVGDGPRVISTETGAGVLDLDGRPKSLGASCGNS
ncbi:diphosphomevalonate decarboxylase [Puccinia sorghi]|uniref:diphosphomevalonate decarboxylase n=1 Tax=Puccinia sorghi TaxID=27349 RepID=A0A0L6UVU8_9BASI|nr:diphosphomevalonate decarboxylase [Puccinia sorghi]